MSGGVLLLCDLDNTLIFSHRRRLAGDVCVERLDGRDQSFTSPAAWEALGRLPENVELIPVTTRSVEQYRRIRWPIPPDWAAAANGGILLGPQGPDADWLAAFQTLAEPYQRDMARAFDALGADPWRLRRRIVDGLFLFAACEDSASALACGAGFQEAGPLTAAVSGRKLYFFPPGLHKGAAAERLRRRFPRRYVVCAGDSPLDLPMLALADTALVPDAGLARLLQSPDVRICPDGRRFPDFILEETERLARRQCAGPPASAQAHA